MTRVYRDKTTEARITQFHEKIAKFLTICVTNLTMKFDKSPPLGAQPTVVFNFLIRGTISRKLCKIEPESQLIINRKLSR